MHHRLILVAVLIVTVTGVLGSIWINGMWSLHHEPEFYPYQIAEQKMIRDWLENQRQGLSGEEYWHYFRAPVKLSALKSYEIVDYPTKEEPTKSYIVRLHSGTHGSLVAKLWKIKLALAGKKIEKIWSVEPLEDTSDLPQQALPQ